MQAALSGSGSPRSGPNRWLVLTVLGVTVPLLVATLPGALDGILTMGAGLAKDVHAEIAALSVVRPGFVPVRAGAAANARDDATASLNAIEVVLGQLAAHDEAMLREPLLDVSRTGSALMSHPGSQPADPLVSDLFMRRADDFSARLAELNIPGGARSSLDASLAAYERTVLARAGRQGRNGGNGAFPAGRDRNGRSHFGAGAPEHDRPGSPPEQNVDSAGIRRSIVESEHFHPAQSG
jgi:hypothetical protein